MSMGLYLKSADGVPAADFTLDFNDISDQPGPFWVSILAWTHTADLGAGSININHFHRDPTGSDVGSSVLGGTLNLADAASAIPGTIATIQRESGSSLWEVRFEAFTPGSALISYRIMHFPSATYSPW
jgi:hypothetical protein